MTADRIARRKGVIYLLPFVITLTVMSFSLKEFGGGLSFAEPAFYNDPRRLIALGSAYLLAFWLCLCNFRWTLRMLGRCWPYLLLLIYIATSAFWSRYPFKVLVNWGHYAGIALVALSVVRYGRDSPLALLRTLAMGVGIAVMASILVSILYPGIGLHSITGRWQGLAGNPNTLGLLCILAVWSGLGLVLLDESRIFKWSGMAVIVTGGVGLFGSHSTTSMVVSLWILASLPVLFYVRNHSAITKMLEVGLLLLLFSGALVGVYAIAPEVMTIDGALRLVGRDSSLTGRTELWEIGLRLIDQHPWRGWGFDSLASVLTRAHMTTGQFHNGYLDLLIRGGMTALILVGIMVFQFYLRVIRFSRRNWASASIAVVLVTGILIHNLTETSLVRTTHALWLMLLVLYFYVSVQQRIRRSIESDSNRAFKREGSPYSQAREIQEEPVQ